MKNEATLEDLFEKTAQYGKTSIELFKLKVLDKTADVASSLISNVIIAVIIGMAVCLANMGLSIWIGELLGNAYEGFFIVAGAYACIGLLVLIFRKQWIKTPVSNSIVEQSVK